jgi:hypothetical protein
MSPRPNIDPRTLKQTDLFRQSVPAAEPPGRAPFQHVSATSAEAADRITQGPAFHGNRLACLNTIAANDEKGGVTRKELAEMYFAGKQNYVTGPVDVLINEEHYVFQEPARDRHGAIMTRRDPKTGEEVVIPKRRDGSAILRLTPRGKAATRKSA